MKSVLIRSFSGPFFPLFGLNTDNIFKPALTVPLFRNSINFEKVYNLLLNLMILKSPIELTIQEPIVYMHLPLHWGVI